MQDASAKGKKVSKKVDRVSEIIVALKEYTAMQGRGLAVRRASQVAPLNNLPNQQLEVILVL